jgi:hypothetical protein
VRRKRERNKKLAAERSGHCDCVELQWGTGAPGHCLIGPRAPFDAMTLDGPSVEVLMRCRVTGLTWRVRAYRERPSPHFDYMLTAEGLERAYELEREEEVSFPEDRLRAQARNLGR